MHVRPEAGGTSSQAQSPRSRACPTLLCHLLGVATSSVNYLVPDVEKKRRAARGRVWVTTYEGATRLVDEWVSVSGATRTRKIRESVVAQVNLWTRVCAS